MVCVKCCSMVWVWGKQKLAPDEFQNEKMWGLPLQRFWPGIVVQNDKTLEHLLQWQSHNVEVWISCSLSPSLGGGRSFGKAQVRWIFVFSACLGLGRRRSQGTVRSAFGFWSLDDLLQDVKMSFGWRVVVIPSQRLTFSTPRGQKELTSFLQVVTLEKCFKTLKLGQTTTSNYKAT